MKSIWDVQDLGDELGLLAISSVGNQILQHGNLVTTMGGLTEFIEGQGSNACYRLDNMEPSDRFSVFSEFSDFQLAFCTRIPSIVALRDSVKASKTCKPPPVLRNELKVLFPGCFFVWVRQHRGMLLCYMAEQDIEKIEEELDSSKGSIDVHDTMLYRFEGFDKG